MDLSVDSTISYRGLGPGTVVSHTEREFDGEMTTFAVIDFPHVEMRTQLPIGDAKVAERLRPVVSEHEAQTLLQEMSTDGTYLARTWDRRKEMADEALRSPHVADWARLLRDFAVTERQGVSLAISDINVIDRATKMVAAEIACATQTEYRVRWREVRDAYQASASAVVEAE